MIIFRLTITIFGLFLLWQIVVWTTGVPHYILPSPLRVSESWWNHKHLILNHSLITFLEIILGLIFGTFLGLFSALLIIWSRNLRRWLLPLLVISQAIPVFAIAPLLVLWFGYGISSKIAMATLIIYFPVAASLFDGLRRTNTGWLDLAYSMEATHWTILKNIRLPAAMPSFASGIRVATAVAPIGAVVGE